MALEHQAPHSHFSGLLGDIKGITPPFYSRVRREMNVNIDGPLD
jgi:hypothetical protein